MIPLRDTIRSQTFPLVNSILIGLNILFFLFELSAPNTERFITLVGLIPRRFLYYRDAHELITVFTSMFLHGGWLHLLSNLLALYIFGDNVEERMGSVRYLLFYLLCGLLASLTHVFFNPYSTLPTIGASGAIAGVLGAYILLYPTARVLTFIPLFIIPYFIEVPAFIYLGFWFISQLFNGALAIATAAQTTRHGGGGVAFLAHVGGFVAGALLGPFFVRRPRLIQRVDPFEPW
jgi:membrane associated rhomboid family serine protease